MAELKRGLLFKFIQYGTSNKTTLQAQSLPPPSPNYEYLYETLNGSKT